MEHVTWTGLIIVEWLGLAAIFGLTWWWQKRIGNAGVVDAVWALTLGLLAIVDGWLGGGDRELRIAIAVMGAIWGGRLGLHLWHRNVGHPEDGRYRQLRTQWGPAANRNMAWFFQLQAVISLALSASFLIPATAPVHFRPASAAFALCIWLAAVIGEAIADHQLAAFKRSHRADHQAVCDRGLWRYSRHPNYFFECVHWLAYPALLIGSSWAFAALAGPLIMAWLLVKVSGLPMTEAQSVAHRPAYADYQRRTSALIPWPPRQG